MSTDTKQPWPPVVIPEQGLNCPRPKQWSGSWRPPKNASLISNPSIYEGKCSNLGVVLALQIKPFNKKVSFHKFIEKAYFYIETNFKDGGCSHPLLHGLTNPTSILLKKHNPTKPLKREDGEPIGNVNIEIYKKEIKQFVQRKINLQRNREKTYGIVWGQYSLALQSFVKGISGFDEQSVAFDIIHWL